MVSAYHSKTCFVCSVNILCVITPHYSFFSVMPFFFFFDRLVEIAGNRFPTYFDSDEKLFCMTRSIHLYRELTCDSVLKRYSFPELKRRKKQNTIICLDYL